MAKQNTWQSSTLPNFSGSLAAMADATNSLSGAFQSGADIIADRQQFAIDKEARDAQKLKDALNQQKIQQDINAKALDIQGKQFELSNQEDDYNREKKLSNALLQSRLADVSGKQFANKSAKRQFEQNLIDEDNLREARELFNRSIRNVNGELIYDPDRIQNMEGYRPELAPFINIVVKDAINLNDPTGNKASAAKIRSEQQLAEQQHQRDKEIANIRYNGKQDSSNSSTNNLLKPDAIAKNENLESRTRDIFTTDQEARNILQRQVNAAKAGGMKNRDILNALNKGIDAYGTINPVYFSKVFAPYLNTAAPATEEDLEQLLSTLRKNKNQQTDVTFPPVRLNN